MQTIIHRLDATHERLLATILPLPDELFSTRPNANEWSIAEVLHHLCLVEERVITDLQKALDKPPSKLSFLRRLIPTSIVAYRLIKVKAPKAVRPLQAPGKHDVIQNYNTARMRLKNICTAEGRDRLSRTIFRHPFLGEISGVATVSFVGYHELRHYKQIKGVIEKLNGIHK